MADAGSRSKYSATLQFIWQNKCPEINSTHPQVWCSTSMKLTTFESRASSPFQYAARMSSDTQPAKGIQILVLDFTSGPIEISYWSYRIPTWPQATDIIKDHGCFYIICWTWHSRGKYTQDLQKPNAWFSKLMHYIWLIISLRKTPMISALGKPFNIAKWVFIRYIQLKKFPTLHYHEGDVNVKKHLTKINYVPGAFGHILSHLILTTILSTFYSQVANKWQS